MDGFAIKSEDWLNNSQKAFSIIGTSFAGHPYQGGIRANECIRTFTGAKIPKECDQIILQENIKFQSGSKVSFLAHMPNESYVRPTGHDIEKNSLIGSKKQRVNPFLIARLSASGIDEFTVIKKPNITIFSSGDELIPIETPYQKLQEGQIFESNKLFLLNALESPSINLIDGGNLPDSKEETKTRLAQAAKDSQLIITTGGVSVGDADFIIDSIREIGSLELWQINLKPGKPMAFGKIKEASILGLPGNPVSTIVTTLLLVKPIIDYLSGVIPTKPLKLKAIAKREITHSQGRTEYQRGFFSVSDDGNLLVEQQGDQSSNRLSSFKNCNCLIEILDTVGSIQVNEDVSIIPLEDFGLLKE